VNLSVTIQQSAGGDDWSEDAAPTELADTKRNGVAEQQSSVVNV